MSEHRSNRINKQSNLRKSIGRDNRSRREGQDQDLVSVYADK